MDNQVTQCPQCQTSFRVSAEQIEAAKGKVRCGSCLHVFRADHHWVEPMEEPANNNVGADVLNLFDDEEEDSIVADTTELEQLIADELDSDSNSSQSEVDEDMDFSESLMELDDLDQDENLFNEFNEISEELKDDDEEWARQLLAEIEEDEKPAGGDSIVDLLHQTEDEDSETEEDLDESIVGPAGGLASLSEETPEPQYKEKWLLDLEAEQAEQAELEPEDENAPEEENNFIEAGMVAESFSPDYDEVREKQKLLNNIEPDPVEMHYQRGLSPLTRQLLWSAACLLALVVLAGQYVSYNFDQLARQPATRGHMASLCKVAGCTLPTSQDLSQIKTNSLVVRPHPKIPGALQLDAIIRNYASFRQPFPALYVQFSALSGEMVAARIFKPEEYLGGELAGGHLMPVRQDVHLSLTLAKPAEDAPNYEVGLLPGA